MKYRALNLFICLFSIGCAKEPLLGHPRPRETEVQATPTPEAPTLVSVKWVEIGTRKQFWDTLFAHPRVVALFGSTSCVPCHWAKAWWEKQAAPDGWTFVYWQWHDELYPDSDPEDQGDIARAFSHRRGVDVDASYPIVSVIERAKHGAPIRDVVSIYFTGGNRYCRDVLKLDRDCWDVTDGVRQWLLAHPRGLKP